MNTYIISGAIGLGLGLAAVWAYVGANPTAPATPPETGGTTLAEVTVPDSLSAEAQIGERAFDAVCAACHGDNGAGVDGSGPPLVHKIYEPSHHADMAFFMAVERGVQAHHWSFGNMPPQQGLTRADVAGIVTYVRELQRANGID
ncbi:MAG: cytochrome C [Pelagibaca sp.]|nr:cytochrome C [Pelagibaca sp.]